VPYPPYKCNIYFGKLADGEALDRLSGDPEKAKWRGNS
jgi:hypothetical protein